jgi:thioesterase domain-containing protein/acyl carrier protein
MNSALKQSQLTTQARNELKTSCEPGELLFQLRNENPGLLFEDAFVVPCWFVQQTRWLEDPSNSDSAVYNYPLLFRIRGPLDEGALQQSLNKIVRRHGVLRSVFRMRDGELIQIVVSSQKQPFRMIDLSRLPETAREAQSQQVVMEEVGRPFDLALDPLLRGSLLRLGVDDHILQLTTHHIVHDDWSTGILSRELSELYQAFAAGTESPLQDLAFQYGDYVRWLQEQLQGNVLRSRLSYWKEQLASAKGFQHLATDFARPAKFATANRGARESIVLPTDLANSLKGLGRQERVSLFMVLLAGFQALLHHYSNDEEIGVASCGANRPLAEVEGVIGRFGNDILLRTSLSGNPTFRELLIRVREVALNAYSDQSLPFGQVVKEVTNRTDVNRNPPFQVMFILQNAPRENRQIPGLSIEWFPLYAGTAKYDLNVWLKIEPTLEVILEYRTDLFRVATMKRVLEEYHTVLRTMVKDPGERVSNLLISSKPGPTPVQRAPIGAKKIVAAKDRVAPKDDVQSRLVELWTAAFGMPIDVDENFFELGGDSLLAARLFIQIEKAFQMELPLAVLLEAPTIRQLAGIISAPIVHSSRSSLVAVQPRGTKPPLFCVHGHTGEIFYCRNLSLSLGVDQPVFGLRSQGLGGETPYFTVEEMAIHYLREIRTVQRKGPYFLVGYCFGGMIAYEMGRLLKTQGEEVALLVMFNTPAPGSLKWWPLRPSYLVSRIARELRKLRTLRMREKLVILRTKAFGLARLVSGSFKGALWHTLAKSSVGVAEKEAQGLLSVADINLLAAKAYDPGTYAGRVIFFLTKDDATSLYATDPAGGWMPLAEGGIEVYAFDRDNTPSLRHAPNIELGETLKSCLASGANSKGRNPRRSERR